MAELVRQQVLSEELQIMELLEAERAPMIVVHSLSTGLTIAPRGEIPTSDPAVPDASKDTVCA